MSSRWIEPGSALSSSIPFDRSKRPLISTDSATNSRSLPAFDSTSVLETPDASWENLPVGDLDALVLELRGLGLNLIASGGIRTGIQAAKAIALGAQAAGVALPVLRAYVAGGAVGVEEYLQTLITELRAAMMLCGCAKIADLHSDCAVLGGKLLEWVMQRNLLPQCERSSGTNPA